VPFVVDALVTLAWAVDEEVSPYAESVLRALRDEDALVPVLWASEVANGLLVAERYGACPPRMWLKLPR